MCISVYTEVIKSRERLLAKTVFFIFFKWQGIVLILIVLISSVTYTGVIFHSKATSYIS